MPGEFDHEGTLNVRGRAARAIRSQLQLASANFEPIQHFLDRMSETLTRQYGPYTALQRRGGMQPTALNTSRCGTPFLIQMLPSR